MASEQDIKADVDSNPWVVESLEEFLFFCCPECNDKSQSKEVFISHAWSNHPKAKETLMNLKATKGEVEEPSAQEPDLDDYAEGEKLEVKLEVYGSDEEEEDEEFDEEEEDDEDSLYNPDAEDEGAMEDDYLEEDESTSEKKSNTQCYYCGEMIILQDIREHMGTSHGSYHGRMHGPPRPIQCVNCKGTFKTDSALKLHLCYDQWIPKKKIGEPYKCDKCDKTYSNRKTFRYHLQSAHTSIKKYRCSQCDFSTKTSSCLSSHVQRVHKKELPHMCPTCGKRFFAAVSLNKHIRTIHMRKPDEKKEVVMSKCDHCTATFPYKFSLVKHMESAHGIAPKRNHTCEECGKSFSTPTSLKTHVNKDHPSEELLKNIECKCDSCDLEFQSAPELNSHLIMVHQRAETLPCDRCQSKWASIMALQKHIAEAHKTIVFPCELCGKTFRNRYTKNAHIKELHQKTEEFHCDQCPKVFTRKYLLLTHTKSIHGNGGDFKCDFCDFRGCNRSRLEVHLKGSHLKNVRYECNLCKYYTFRKDCLGTHIRTVHQKNKPHKCELCGLGFFARRDKVKHMEKHPNHNLVV